VVTSRSPTAIAVDSVLSAVTDIWLFQLVPELRLRFSVSLVAFFEMECVVLLTSIFVRLQEIRM
jgi:hypothetical protein